MKEQREGKQKKKGFVNTKREEKHDYREKETKESEGEAREATGVWRVPTGSGRN